MPQVNLTVQDDGGRTLSTPGTGEIYLPQRRVRAWARLGREILPRQVVVDTGAPACLLSKQVWATLHARGDIVWAAHPPTETAHSALPRIDIHGGNYPFRLGRIRLELVDLFDGQLGPRDVLMICTEDEPTDSNNDPPRLPRLLLVGLAEVMHGRSLLLRGSEDGRQWSAVLSEL